MDTLSGLQKEVSKADKDVAELERLYDDLKRAAATAQATLQKVISESSDDLASVPLDKLPAATKRAATAEVDRLAQERVTSELIARRDKCSIELRERVGERDAVARQVLLLEFLRDELAIVDRLAPLMAELETLTDQWADVSGIATHQRQALLTRTAFDALQRAVEAADNRRADLVKVLA